MKLIIAFFLVASASFGQDNPAAKPSAPPAIAAPEAPAPIPLDMSLEVVRWQTIASMKAIETAQAVACAKQGGLYSVNPQNFAASCTAPKAGK